MRTQGTVADTNSCICYSVFENNALEKELTINRIKSNDVNNPAIKSKNRTGILTWVTIDQQFVDFITYFFNLL